MCGVVTVPDTGDVKVETVWCIIKYKRITGWGEDITWLATMWTGKTAKI
jgi:hypothetical protein